MKYKRSIKEPTYGWQGATHKSVGFVQSVPDNDNLIVSFCSVEAQVRLLANEVIKVIPLDRGQHVQLKSDIIEPRYEFFTWTYILATVSIIESELLLFNKFLHFIVNVAVF